MQFFRQIQFDGEIQTADLWCQKRPLCHNQTFTLTFSIVNHLEAFSPKSSTPTKTNKSLVFWKLLTLQGTEIFGLAWLTYKSSSSGNGTQQERCPSFTTGILGSQITLAAIRTAFKSGDPPKVRSGMTISVTQRMEHSARSVRLNSKMLYSFWVSYFIRFALPLALLVIYWN